MKRFTLLIAIIAAGLASASAQEYGVQFTRYAGHIVTAGSTTTNVTTGHDRVLHTIVFNVTGTPTSEVITIVDQTPTTPKIIYKSAALSSATTTPVVVALPVGIKCTGGIDILTTGTVGTGVVDAWLSYR
jgi:hypothetical protein